MEYEAGFFEYPRRDRDYKKYASDRRSGRQLKPKKESEK